MLPRVFLRNLNKEDAMFQREITSQNEPISAYRNIERRGHNDHRANYGKRRRCGVEKDSFKCGSKYDLHK